MNTYEFIEHIVFQNIQAQLDKEFDMIKFPTVRWDYNNFLAKNKELLDTENNLAQCSLTRAHDELLIHNFVDQFPLEYMHRFGSNLAIEGDGLPRLKKMGNTCFIEHDWEPVYFGLDKHFWKSIYYWKLQYKTNFVVLHSEYNSEDIKKLNRAGIKDVHWFAHAYLCSEFYFTHYRKLAMVANYRSRPLKYRWLCTNRLVDTPRDYRIKFLNLLDTSTGVYSLLEEDPHTNRTPTEIFPDNRVIPYSFDVHLNHSAEINVTELTPWNTSFLHVVNETVWQDKIHFTEKVFKPIVLHQPFVVLQAPGSLTYLRSYGFKTFGAWWDESYDSIEDPQERMQAIADIVNWIGSRSMDEIQTMRMEMASVLEHNFRHFYENIPAICLNELCVGLTLTP